MRDELVARRVAGLAVLLSGGAMVAWAIINGVTGGGLDTGVTAVGPVVDRIGRLLMIAYNLLLLPIALFLGVWLWSKSPYLVALYTLCGIVASLLWAMNGPMMEPAWLLFSAFWWLGIGSVLRSEYRVLGIATIVVGSAALLDGIVGVLDIDGPLFWIAGAKIPFSLIWNFWIGTTLLLPARKRASDNHKGIVATDNHKGIVATDNHKGIVATVEVNNASNFS